MASQVLSLHGHITAIVPVVAMDDGVRTDVDVDTHITLLYHLHAVNYRAREEGVHASVAMLAHYEFMRALLSTVYAGDASFATVHLEVTSKFVALYRYAAVVCARYLYIDTGVVVCVDVSELASVVTLLSLGSNAVTVDLE